MKPATYILLTLALFVVLFAIYRLVDADFRGLDEPHIAVRMQFPGARNHPRLVRHEDGSYEYLIVTDGGETLRLSPEAFSDRLYESSRSNPWWASVLNVSSPLGIVWVTIGLLGQVLFSGRMIVQWLVSEKAKRSVVPTAFWWMSLAGATMLLVYFLWRKDIVGVLGQGTGWMIYVRNLWLIYHRHETPPVTADPAPEPGLADHRATHGRG